MSYTWYVVSVKDTEGKLYAFADRLSNNCNLVGIAKDAETMNACESKREAEEIAESWNQSFIRNGTANKWLVKEQKGEMMT